MLQTVFGSFGIFLFSTLSRENKKKAEERALLDLDRGRVDGLPELLRVSRLSYRVTWLGV